MLTDWLLVRRLGAELERALRGARIRSAGMMADGRFGLRTTAGLVAIDAFGATPLVTLEPDARVEATPGWPRAAAASLEGLRIERVRARQGDRLLAIDCAAQSRFGVSSGYRLVAELVPRFGNVVLLKGETVVSSAKEFSAGGATLRTVRAGEPYEPPPLRQAAGPPRLVAESLAIEAERGGTRVREAYEAALGDQSPERSDVFVYRDGERIVAVHVVPLLQYANLTEQRLPALLPLLSIAIATDVELREAQAAAARRGTLSARVQKRRMALAHERAAMERERDDAEARETLRTAGELLYAHLDDVPPRAERFVPPSDPSVTIELDPELDAKANAAAIFKRYKKAVAKREHLERRLSDLQQDESFADQLVWEIERAEPATFEDLSEDLDRLERRKAIPRAGKARRLGAIEVSLGSDARVLVGRSPKGNADLTFRIAKPDDLWFHARNTPGAHVILRIDSARAPAEDELRTAAALAAFHSKARGADKAEVDYTQRKHVRKQRGGAPGLVWYTNARTILVEPKDGAAS